MTGLCVRGRPAALAMCAVMSLAVALAAGPAEAKTRLCGSISFAPNTDFGAFGIVATNTSCTTARNVARRSRSLNVTKGPFRYRAYGFTCRGTPHDEGLASVTWRCTRGVARVRFERS